MCGKNLRFFATLMIADPNQDELLASCRVSPAELVFTDAETHKSHEEQGTRPALEMTSFSVIMPTRNRPQQFSEALASILAQSVPAAEIIVVDDGSAEEHRAPYRAVLERGADRIKWYSLVARSKGHGGAYARNFGAAHATGDYLCFLDDDDFWIDTGHLERTRAVIDDNPEPVDLYMSDQVACFAGERLAGPKWIEGVAEIAHRAGKQPDSRGAYTISVDELMRNGNSCHLNTLIVRRGLFEAIGGFDENNRWEDDRDLYLRLVDRARVIKYSPTVVAQHNVPDPVAKSSITTATPDLERRLFQIRSADRAILLAAQPAIRKHGREQKAYALRKVAEALARQGLHVDAAYYAREALGARPTLKWAAYTAWRMLRAMV